jgi:hypothetical protein
MKKGQTILNPPTDPELTNCAIWTRIQSVWWLAKEDIAMHKFSSHLEAQLVHGGLEPPKAYRDDRVAWEIVELIGQHFRQMLKERVQKSPFFGIMADETTDNSVTQQLIVYIKFLGEKDGHLGTCIEYLDLVCPASGSAEDIKVS